MEDNEKAETTSIVFQKVYELGTRITLWSKKHLPKNKNKYLTNNTLIPTPATDF